MKPQCTRESNGRPHPVRRLRIVSVAALLALAASALILGLAIPSVAQDRPSSPAAPPTPVYVDKDVTGGAGDGTSWTDAHTNIQDALYGATAVEIWVAEGVYYPDEGKGQTEGDQSATFLIGDAVALYGGFSGTEEDLGERDWVHNVTVLSGDIDHNDTTDANGVVTDPEDTDGDNSYHVVTTEDVMFSAELNGFTVTAGHADSATEEEHYKGAGIYSLNASPTLANLIIQGNKAAGGLPESPEGYGGGMFNDNGDPSFTDVTFRNNFAQISGGGLYTSDSDDAIADLTFVGNQAGVNGGGMYLTTSVGHSLSNLIFTGNSAGDKGGGLYVESDGSSSLSNGLFDDNSAVTGGGLYLDAFDFDLSSTYLVTNDASGQGGGMFAQLSTYSLTGVSFEDNHADTAGGGVYADESVGTVIASTFIHNTSALGAGMYVDDHDNPDKNLTMDSSLFVNNLASQDGGGLYVVDSTEGTLDGVWFTSNEAATGNGGGMFLSNSEGYELSGTDFDANEAVSGGGLYADSCDATLSDVVFQANEATQDGGGMFSSGAGSSLRLVNVAFSENDAVGSGGGLSTASPNVTIVNVAFSGNAAGGSGGGLSTASAIIDIVNATFSGNAAVHSGGGVSTTSPNMTIDNTVIWNNKDSSGTDTPYSSISGDAAIDYSLIQWVPASSNNLNGNDLDNDPMFVIPADPTTTPPTSGILSVKYGSPIVDVGNNAVVPTGVTLDLAGNTRIYTDTVDMGAYELQLACPPPETETTLLYVDHTANGNNTGTSWLDALEDLRDAFTLAEDCAGIIEIWVAEGVYRPDEGVGMVPDSRTETYQLIDGLAVYGGFDGTELLLEERDWRNQPTVLSGDVDRNDINSGGIVLDPANIRGANSYHVVTGGGIGNTTFLDGFVITAGQANGNPLDQADRGAGLYNDDSSPTLANLSFVGNFAGDGAGLVNVNGSNPPMTNVQFQSNTAGSFGGAIYNEASHPTLTDVQFRSNSAGSVGGAIYNKDSDPSLTDGQFRSNSAGSFGGAIYNEGSDPSLTNALLSGNTASDGAAIYNNASHPSLTNALLSGNTASAGAAIYNTASNPILVNVTVTGNRASSRAGGMFNTSTSQPTVHSSIFWDNQDSTGAGTASATIHNEDAGSVSLINYSLVQALSDIDYTGANNLDEYPWFTTPIDPSAAPTTAGDLSLGVFSPAIDVGDNAANSTLTDLAGNPRKINVIIDLGAYEAPYRPVYHTYLPLVLRDYP